MTAYRKYRHGDFSAKVLLPLINLTLFVDANACPSRRARRAAAPGECRRPLVPARRQGQMSLGGGHPATDAGGPWRLEPQNGRGITDGEITQS